MKATLRICLPALCLAAALTAQSSAPRFTVVDIGTLAGGATWSFANYWNDNRQIVGSAGLADGTQQAVVWEGPFRIDLGTLGLNSGIFGITADGQALMISGEINKKDPNNENFCGWGTGLACAVFSYQRGVMTQFPTLGGNNANGSNINNKGEICGTAENTTCDTTCPAHIPVGGISDKQAQNKETRQERGRRC